MEQARINEFASSLTRCMTGSGFLDRFYELFQNSSEEVAEKFRDTDMERQKSALRSSLYVMVVAIEGGDPALAYLDRVARQHSRQDLDIPPQMYEQWLDCLIKAVKEYDSQYTGEIEKLWRAVMRFGIDYMTARY